MVKLLLPAALLSVLAASRAADYSFEIPRLDCNASIEADGTLLIHYEIEFECRPGAHEIDVVDIGFPTSSYEPGSVAAEVDGHAVTDIRRSTVLPVGVEVHLGSHCIEPGETGVFALSGANPGLVYADPSQAGYASLEFTPTWFDASLLEGETLMTIRIQFPPGADSASTRYYDVPFTRAWRTGEDRIVYEWQAVRSMSSAYMVGVSFPASLISGPIAKRAPPQSGAWAASSDGGGAARGWMPCCCPAAVASLFTGIVLLAVIQSKSRRLQYIRPTIGVEGVGIKRGLSVPQVGILLGQKLDRVLMLIIYGLVRKGAAVLDSSSGKPVFTSVQPGMEGLLDYERAILEAVRIGKAGREALDIARVRDAFVALVKDVENRMKGFSVKETREYYRSIMTEAWKQIRASTGAGEIEAVVAEQLPWLLLEDRVEKRLEEFPDLRGLILHPARLGGSYRPVFSTGQGMSIQQFCADVASRLENTASSLLGNVDGFTSKVTAVTNPIPVSSHSGTRAGGGCACACACAGCACACAGGGR